MKNIYENIISFLIAIPIVIVMYLMSLTVFSNIMDALPDCFSHYILNVDDHYIQDLPW